ncbi:glycosyltransferase family 4 protein [Methylococcus sp. EFPC2]|uniref:glycosyltransferase family 4 protein n=1 Tax=Methylococcus sp. EFPC2 TaxID=2812648 RepID=UPI0019674CFB|nr:glycosyltransferase family 4 protein [Methylococcus sp. EFPC2]QSA98465.1 glycosyltransferase family 4 protein [Methylococcus sp. EFPC2]
MNKRPKLLFFVTEDWYFCSHRLPLALAAREAGFEVVVATRVREHGTLIRDSGLKLIPLELSRRSANPASQLVLLARLVSLYRCEKPDIVHHVAIKPVFLGSLAALLTGTPRIVNAVAGLGWLFTSTSRSARLLGKFVATVFRALLGRSQVIVQNPDDHAFLMELGVPSGRIALIRGSGVDIEAYSPTPEPQKTPLVILASRLLWNKGVGEFVEAARTLRAQGIRARFALVGEPDEANPASIEIGQIARWQQDGIVERWGKRDDMPAVMAQAHIVCLPSYREGLPKVLIEAAACGRPIVTTDVPGCREVVRDGENGLLVPARSVQPLADALRRLIEDPDLRKRMGSKGREMAVAEFSVNRVNRETLALYRDILA